jgi:hypothetical protein
MEAILLKLSQDCDYTIGPEKVLASQRYDKYQERYKEFIADTVAGNTSPQAPQTGSIFSIGLMDT